MSLSTKRGVFVDNMLKIVRPSTKTGVFMDGDVSWRHEGRRSLHYRLIPRGYYASDSIYGLCGTLTEVTGWDYWIRRVIPERNGQSNHLSALEYSCISPPT